MLKNVRTVNVVFKSILYPTPMNVVKDKVVIIYGKKWNPVDIKHDVSMPQTSFESSDFLSFAILSVNVLLHP